MDNIKETDKLSMTNMTYLVTKVLDLELKTAALTNLLIKSGTVTMEELKVNAEVTMDSKEFNEIMKKVI